MSLDLLVLQQQLNGKVLLTAISNYKKSPFERRTVSFIERKWQALHAKWAAFRALDKRIRQFKDTANGHYYFQQELFALVRDKYMAVRVRVNTDKKQLLKCKVCPAVHAC